MWTSVEKYCSQLVRLVVHHMKVPSCIMCWNDLTLGQFKTDWYIFTLLNHIRIYCTGNGVLDLQDSWVQLKTGTSTKQASAVMKRWISVNDRQMRQSWGVGGRNPQILKWREGKEWEWEGRTPGYKTDWRHWWQTNGSYCDLIKVVEPYKKLSKLDESITARWSAVRFNEKTLC
jgi:hypothetical protein